MLVLEDIMNTDDNSAVVDMKNNRCADRVISQSTISLCTDESDDSMAPPSPVPVALSSLLHQINDIDNTITGRLRNINDRYHIDTKVLGTGHFGSVRQCIHRVTGERYAVKSISKTDPDIKHGALAREIILLQDMKHDNIIRLVDVFEDTDHVHLVTDICTGGELFDRIVERSSSSSPSSDNNNNNGAPCLDEHEAAQIIYQLLNAVSYMHENGVVHRDIKPENILFQTTDADSSIKLIDFGLSRKHDETKEPPMSATVGTPYYIAPEVLQKKYDKSCDLWSVGVIAYILLCGYPPFNGANNDATHRRVARGRYSFPSKDWKYTSREARDFIRNLLQLDTSKRMSMDEALKHPWIVHYAASASASIPVVSIVDEGENQNQQQQQPDNSIFDESIFRDDDERLNKSGREGTASTILRSRIVAKRNKMRISMFGICA